MLAADPNELGKGRDARAYGRKYSRLTLVDAWRIHAEDRELEYQGRKRAVQRECRRLGDVFATVPTKFDDVRLDVDLDRDVSADDKLDANVNEKWFLHGTKPDFVIPILNDGLNERLSGGLFGKGIYLAEDAAISTSTQRQTRSIRHLVCRFAAFDVVT